MTILVKLLFALFDIRRSVEELRKDVHCLRGEVKRLSDSLEHPDLRAVVFTAGAPTEEK